jgi:hypothetical protein
MLERRIKMAKVKMVLSWWIPIVLITVVLMTPVIGQAKAIKIWPDQLIPDKPIGEYYQSHVELRNGNFEFTLNLPLGARITKVTAYLQGYDGQVSQVTIYRVKMEAYYETFGSIAEGYSDDSTGDVLPIDVVISGDPIIRAGYRYFVLVFTPNDMNIFRGMKITYQE